MPTEAQLVGALQQADANGDTAAAQQFAGMIKQQRAAPQPTDLPTPAQTPANNAYAAGQEAGAQTSPLMAGIDQASNSVLMGQGDRVMGAVRYAAQRIAGVKNPDDYATDRAFAGGQLSGSQEAHPIAGTVGGVAGAFMGGGIASKAVSAAGKAVPAIQTAADMLTPVTRDAAGTPLRAGSAVGNVVKSAVANAAIGGGIALANGENPAQAGQTALISAAAGPTVGKVAEFSLGALSGASSRAYQTLAKTIGETPDTLEKAYDSFVKLTGAEPTMAQLSGLKTQGQIKSLADANSTIADAAVKAARAGSAPLHEQLQTFQNATRPQTVAAVNDLRDTMMDSNMNQPHPQTGVPLRDTPVSDPSGLLVDPHIEYALRPNTAVNARLGQTSPVIDRIRNDQVTLGDVETIRKALRDQQNGFSSPAPGSNNARDPILAKEFGDIAAKVENLGTAADPDYAKVLGQYRDLSRYGQGLAHGMTGKSVNQIDPGDSQLGAALKTPTGIAGYEHGNALNTAQQALKAISPGSISPGSAAPGLQDIAHATLSTAGKVGLVSKTMRAIPGLHLPESAQQVVAKQLFDPTMSKQAVANLRRGNVTDQQIRQLGTMVGGVAGANIAQYLSQQGQ